MCIHFAIFADVPNVYSSVLQASRNETPVATAIVKLGAHKRERLRLGMMNQLVTAFSKRVSICVGFIAAGAISAERFAEPMIYDSILI